MAGYDESASFLVTYYCWKSTACCALPACCAGCLHSAIIRSSCANALTASERAQVYDSVGTPGKDVSGDPGITVTLPRDHDGSEPTVAYGDPGHPKDP